MKRILRRIFTAEFKRVAIKVVTEQSLTITEASKKLDIATKSLRAWMDQLERGKLKTSLGASKLTPDQHRSDRAASIATQPIGHCKPAMAWKPQ